MFSQTSSLDLPLNLAKPARTVVFVVLALSSFFIPFSLGGPQWLVGTGVNAFLFLAALFLPKKSILPLVVLPSLGVLGRGIVFGPLTMFLVYFLPFIWIGNLTLIAVFRKAHPRFGYLGGVCLAALAKFLLLFLVARLYFELSLAPQVFLQLMGLNQIFTALAGGAVSFFIFKLYGQSHPGSKRAA